MNKTVANKELRAAQLRSGRDYFDYIVVGGGSAGCVIAARLAQRTSAKVLLLEAGPKDIHPYFRVPAGFAKMLGDKTTWGWSTTPQSELSNTQYLFPQGRVLGGGSSINAQVYTRGNPNDYDYWANECNCDGWAYKDILPYFMRAEDNSSFSDDFHGVGGPLGVSDAVNPLPISRAFVRGAQEAGIPFSSDFNATKQTGFGLYQTTIRNAERSSTSRAYLHSSRRPKNLTVLTGRLAQKLVVEGGKVTAVVHTKYNGTDSKTAYSTGEVIVTSGAIGTPSLLMRSGIGDKSDLREAGIEFTCSVPGVGKNLQDHFDLYVVSECSGDFTYDKHDRPHNMLASALQYLLFKNGPAASNLCEAGGFASTEGNSDWPDIQFHVVLGSGINDEENKLKNCGVTLNTAYMRPKSVGSVKLRSSNIKDHPLIDPNFLAHPDDKKHSIAGFRMAREILMQPSLSPYLKREVLPGPEINSDEEILNAAHRFSKTDYHPVGTCKMGTDDMAVVDPSTLKVRGIKNLMICDSSIMPRIISSNTNAITIAIAEKAADIILANNETNIPAATVVSGEIQKMRPKSSAENEDAPPMPFCW